MKTPSSQRFVLVFVCLVGVVGLSSCSTVKGMLRPMVCDCDDRKTTAENCPADKETERPAGAVAAADSEVDASRASARATANEKKQQANVREIDREPESPEVDPKKVVDPTLPDARVDLSSGLETLRDTYGLPDEMPDDAVGLVANFEKGDGDEFALVEPGHRIRVFGEDGVIADLKFSTTAVDKRPDDPKRSGISAVRLVRDGTAQILAHWSQSDEDGNITYRVAAYKVIGSFIGTVFERTLATRQKGDGESFELAGTYEFLHGDTNRYIRWIPSDKSGTLTSDKATILKWNEWEGVYRVPKPPPTAPERQEARLPDAQDGHNQRT